MLSNNPSYYPNICSIVDDCCCTNLCSLELLNIVAVSSSPHEDFMCRLQHKHVAIVNLRPTHLRYKHMVVKVIISHNVSINES